MWVNLILFLFIKNFIEKQFFEWKNNIKKFNKINKFDLRLINNKEDFFQNKIYNFQMEIPLNYLSLFKKIYPKRVCITKEKNLYNEGIFVVKKFTLF